MRPPQPPNAHPTSLTTVVDFPDEAAKRAKAKAKRDAKEAKAKQTETKNVELTQQDMPTKKERAFASKASRSKKDEPSSAAKPRRETRKLHLTQLSTHLATKKMMMKKCSMTSWLFLTSRHRVHHQQKFGHPREDLPDTLWRRLLINLRSLCHRRV